jgi:GAF domain-containing protein
MRGFCEIVLANLINDLGASHGALHVGRSVEDVFNGRVHDVTRVQGGAGGVGEVPRQDGFGAAAVRDRRCVHFHRRDLELRNPKLAELGIRQTTVLPLLDAARNPFGVLYLHHDEPSTADVDEYADIASEALGVAIHTKRCALSPTNLLAEARGFTMPLAETLEQRLTRMAGFTANLLGCDHVSIVVKASGAPLVVHYGRYILRRPTNRGPLDADLIALSSMDFDGARYIGREEEPYPEDYARGRFVEDELIQATAVLPMWERGRALMVVDYRAPQGFGQIERELHESAAGLIARAISAAERDDADRELRSAVSDLVDATARAQTDTPTELHLGFERGSGWKPPA